MIDTTSKQNSSPTLKKHKSKPPLTEEEVKKQHCHHGPMAKCINCLGVTKENVKDVKSICKHGPTAKCPNCLTTDKDQPVVKHESFEHFISEIKVKCKGKHKADQKCQNCVPFSQFSYKVNYKCPNHQPYPIGMCNKCLPPAVVLKRQSYRHVDYVSFMNFNEMSSFVNFWQ
jgi:nuclear protein localization protein 4 homolog